ncbi:MAG: nuclear pore complex subunit [Bacteroidetes bacterium RBG_13_42_15]|nr:MAG: nuclear pore complex subunit [Bacteroidetes bacterium RBG_13_42_15]
METIKIQGTEDTPKIILDAENEVLEISGRSLPEDVSSFYEPVINWLNEYAEKPNKKTVLNFKLTYFNTASSKLLLDILMKLEELHEKGHDVLIRWHYPEDDEDMEEAGEEYADIVDVPFEQVAYS